MPQNTHEMLGKIVEETTFWPEWTLRLADDEGALCLVVTIDTVSNYDREKRVRVSHWHPVPTATYNRKTWERWVFDQVMRTLNHEVGESLRFGGRRPFAPCHGPGEDPYIVHDSRTDEEIRTMQDGTVRPRRGE